MAGLVGCPKGLEECVDALAQCHKGELLDEVLCIRKNALLGGTGLCDALVALNELGECGTVVVGNGLECGRTVSEDSVGHWQDDCAAVERVKGVFTLLDMDVQSDDLGTDAGKGADLLWLKGLGCTDEART